jgi:Protein of unknown function (DUF1579)
MKKFWLAPVLVALIASNPSSGQEKAPGALTETHTRIAKRAGEYTTSTKLTLPDGKAIETAGTAKLTSVLGGRFVQEENSGTLFDMPISGLRLLGYNAEAEQYEAMWLYTGATSMMTLIGKMKDDKKTVEFTATFTSGKDKKTTLNVVYHLIDDDHFSVDLIAPGADGAKGPTMTTTYTRKK